MVNFTLHHSQFRQCEDNYILCNIMGNVSPCNFFLLEIAIIFLHWLWNERRPHCLMSVKMINLQRAKFKATPKFSVKKWYSGLVLSWFRVCCLQFCGVRVLKFCLNIFRLLGSHFMYYSGTPVVTFLSQLLSSYVLLILVLSLYLSVVSDVILKKKGEELKQSNWGWPEGLHQEPV